MQRVKRRERHEVEQEWDGIGQRHAKRVLRRRLNPNGGEVGLLDGCLRPKLARVLRVGIDGAEVIIVRGERLAVALGALDVVEQVAVLARLLEHAPPREEVIPGDNGIAVAPLGCGAEAEGPDALVVAEINAYRAGGDELEVHGVVGVKPFADAVRDPEVLEVGHLVQVERDDVAAVDEREVRAALDAAA